MFIESTGMVCSVGLSAAAACAAMRAGVANFQETTYLDDEGEPIIAAMVPGLAPELKREERLACLLAAAVADCLRGAIDESLERIPLIIGLAEPGRPGGGAGLADAIAGLLAGKVGMRFLPGLSRVIAHGHTAGFEGLRVARQLLAQPDVPACIVCGVDSYVNASSLLWLDRHQRLKTRENADGVIPGEGAGAVLVTKRQTSESAVRVQVTGLGFASETAAVLTEEPLRGLGLAEATRGALGEAGIELHAADFRISDMTGESYGFREQALSVSQVMRARRERFPLWHPSDSAGDIGAASGTSQLAMFWHSARKAYAPGNQAVCFTSAVPGGRAVAIVRALVRQ